MLILTIIITLVVTIFIIYKIADKNDTSTKLKSNFSEDLQLLVIENMIYSDTVRSEDEAIDLVYSILNCRKYYRYVTPQLKEIEEYIKNQRRINKIDNLLNE